MPKTQVTIPFFIPHRGCPHRCIFCSQWKASGATALPDGDSIRRKVTQFIGNLKSSVTRVEIAFFGGTFTGLDISYQLELLESASRCASENIIHGIRVSTRPDFVTDESIKLLLDYGVTTVEIGAQSFSDEVLAASMRGHTSGDTVIAAERIREAGMDLVLQLMPGLPGDTREKSIQSAYAAAALKPAGARIYPAVVIAGTEMDNMYRKKLYTPLTLDEAVDVSAAMTGIFTDNGITVIRTGLHPFTVEETGSITAGPYHPGFGFLVKSRLKRDQLERLISVAQQNNSGTRTLAIPVVEKEEYIGHRRENIEYLKDKFGIHELRLHYQNIREAAVLS